MSSELQPEETVELTLTLNSKLVQQLREKMAAEKCASESEYIELLLVSDLLFKPIDEEELAHWMNTEGVRRLEAIKADPSTALTVEQAFSCLTDEENSHD